MESADTDEGLADLLIDGARYGDLEDVQQAIEQGAQVDWQDEQGRTGASCYREYTKTLRCCLFVAEALLISLMHCSTAYGERKRAHADCHILVEGWSSTWIAWITL